MIDRMSLSALQWSTLLPADLAPGSFVQIELTMRKVGPPAVLVAWELILAPTG